MQKRKHRILSMVLIVAMTAGMVIGLGGCGKKNGDELTITNVSYDPTREFYEKYNVLFEQYYEKNFRKKSAGDTVARRFRKSGKIRRGRM